VASSWRDFSPYTGAVVDPKLPIHTVADVVNYAKAHPKESTTGGSGFAC
jgi:tripartite-type tricarboxylate transporter receptor subunit TctC